jgi:hypothetical protein
MRPSARRAAPGGEVTGVPPAPTLPLNRYRPSKVPVLSPKAWICTLLACGMVNQRLASGTDLSYLRTIPRTARFRMTTRRLM